MTQTNVTRITIKPSKPDPKRVLRALPYRESFYFYRAVGQPVGECATSLSDFQNKIQTVDSLSIEFHFYRGDFAHWIKNVIGDSTLASQLTVHGKNPLKGEELRGYVAQKLKVRFSQYQAAS
jgi:hypothetical protein